uniref:Tubulin--tyrosine ligase-like protein 9 n=1 Tax=Macrostomum lignano TaxID=282301 RepID=A0A1I8F1A1_9PLAT
RFLYMASNTFDAVYAQRSVAEASAQERATLGGRAQRGKPASGEHRGAATTTAAPPLPPSLQQQTALAVNGKVGKRRPLFGIGSTKKSAAASQAVKQRMLHSQSDTGRSKKEDKSKRQRHTPQTIANSMNNPNADFDELKLSPFYEGYDTRNLLGEVAAQPGGPSGRRRVRQVLSMREMMQYSLDSGAHCLLWVNSGLARRFLPRMRRGSQILGRVQGDVIVKDKQNLASLLIEHQFREWLEWPTHVCVNEKNEEIKRNNQRLCRHQYIGHYMGKCIDDDAPNCPNHEYYFRVLPQALLSCPTDMEFKKTVWLAKPAYLTGGKGFFLIRGCDGFPLFLPGSKRHLRPARGLHAAALPAQAVHAEQAEVCGFFHPDSLATAAVPWTVKFEQLHQTKMSGNVFEHITAELYKLNKRAVPGESEEDDDDEKAQCFAFNDACEQIATGAKKAKWKMSCRSPAKTPDSGKFLEKDFDKFHWRFKYMIEVLCAKLDPIVRDKRERSKIFGLDILIDSDTKPWLLEVNSHVATEQIYDRSQCRVISNVVTEAICIVVELFQKAFEEEAIAMEFSKAPLIKLTRAQRLMTAKAEQDALDKLAGLLEMTEISQRKPPIFLPKLFLVLKRNEAIVRKNFKADEALQLSHDYMDYFRHAFWREKTEEEMKEFEEKAAEAGRQVHTATGAAADSAWPIAAVEQLLKNDQTGCWAASGSSRSPIDGALLQPQVPLVLLPQSFELPAASPPGSSSSELPNVASRQAVAFVQRQQDSAQRGPEAPYRLRAHDVGLRHDAAFPFEEQKELLPAASIGLMAVPVPHQAVLMARDGRGKV